MPGNMYVRVNLVHRLLVYNLYSKILISDLCLKISSRFNGVKPNFVTTRAWKKDEMFYVLYVLQYPSNSNQYA